MGMGLVGATAVGSPVDVYRPHALADAQDRFHAPAWAEAGKNDRLGLVGNERRALRKHERLVSNSANTPTAQTNHLPAAVRRGRERIAGLGPVSYQFIGTAAAVTLARWSRHPLGPAAADRSSSILHGAPNALGGRRHLDVGDAEFGQRVDQRVGDGPDRSGLPPRP
jgi:hypothetical protein